MIILYPIGFYIGKKIYEMMTNKDNKDENN